jgi:hypothetical protein
VPTWAAGSFAGRASQYALGPHAVSHPLVSCPAPPLTKLHVGGQRGGVVGKLVGVGVGIGGTSSLQY